MTLLTHSSASSDFGQMFETILPHPVRWAGDEGRTLCPLHDDHNPSLSVNRKKGVWRCFGCGAEGYIVDLARRLGAGSRFGIGEGTPPRKKTKSGTSPGKSKVVAEYIYTDEHGGPVLKVCRIEPKSFFQMRPDGRGGWVKGGVQDPVPYRLPEVIGAVKSGKPVFVVEGEKDVENLRRIGLTATTNPGGAGKWPKEFGKYFKDANVVVLPDNDKPGRDHAEKVARELQPVASSVRVVELPGLPEKGDVSDWLAAGHIKEELVALVEKTSSWTPKLTVLLGGGTDVREAYFDGGTFLPKLLGDELLRRHHFAFVTGRLYAYRDGVYRPEGEQAVRALVADLLGTEFRRNRFDETLFYVETKTHRNPEDLNPDDGLINLKNGLLNWKTRELHPHTPDRLSTIQIPVEYNPKARCPNIEKFLREVLPEDAIPAMVEWAGYLLIPSTKFEKAVMLTGTGANGKSTLLNLLTIFLGKENVATVPLQTLEESRWGTAELQGKLANICADLSPKRVQSSEVFKKLVSGDEVFAERKGRDPFHFRPFVKLMFSANEPPGSSDVSEAFYRRWLVFDFPNRFEHGVTADENLIDKLTTPEELSGLLNLALEGLRRLHEQRRFTEGESMQQAFKDYRAATNSVEAFVDECCSLEKNRSIRKVDLHRAYVQWCDAAGIKPLGRNKFYRRLEASALGIDEYRENNERWYLGIKLHDEVWEGIRDDV